MQTALTIMTFGFKYGPPPTNYYFDVSFLKNPARQAQWTLFDRPSAAMHAFVLDQPECGEFLARLTPLVRSLITFDDDVRVGLGCSAGRHRSYIVAEELKRRLESEQVMVRLIHREEHLW